MINALTFQNKDMLEQFIKMNNIKGCFLSKEYVCNNRYNFHVYEGKEDYTGFLAAEFTLKRDAIAFIERWCKHTGLKRFENFNC